MLFKKKKEEKKTTQKHNDMKQDNHDQNIDIMMNVKIINSISDE